MTHAETIYRRLKETARRLSHFGYGAAQLIFSDWSFVSSADYLPSPPEEIEELLRRGERPLGFIAMLRSCRSMPLVCPWEEDDEQARMELLSLTRMLYRHRMPEMLEEECEGAA